MTWGGFNWKMNFRWYAVPQREIDRRNGDRSLPLRYSDAYLNFIINRIYNVFFYNYPVLHVGLIYVWRFFVFPVTKQLCQSTVVSASKTCFFASKPIV